MVEVSEEFLKDVRTLVDYNYKDECKHCEEDNGIEFQQDGTMVDVHTDLPVKKVIHNHIFFHIKAVDEFLDEVNI